MRLKALARRVKRQADRELRKGRLTSEEHRKVVAVTNNQHTLRMLRDKIRERRINPYEGPDRLVGMSWKEIWANLWDWLVENWPTILRLILTIAPLLLMENPNEDS